ncbi:MAG: hypothetical protein KatS3mg077_1940 [Candidatus Binatia bacterium]|nr:MAG: hypothetical protein KatS3mg077_1940 [Candidatus Binatia bacterium]
MLAVTNVVFDVEASAELARRVRAQHRRCWRNAALAVSHLGSGARYVEGWVVTGGTVPYVIEHGWCEFDGRVVDPTYVPWVTPEEPPVAYFAGASFTPAQAERALLHKLPIALEHEQSVHWRAFEWAWRDATRRARLDERPQTRVVHCRRESFDVYIGRPTQWANPFHVGLHGTREQVIAQFCRRLIRHPGLLRGVWSLRGYRLGCRCAPKPCHGDVLAELANVERIPEGQLLVRWLEKQPVRAIELTLQQTR